MDNGTITIAFFNKGSAAQTITYDLLNVKSDLSSTIKYEMFKEGKTFGCKNLWDNTFIQVNTVLS